jgi:hypothetical protein
MEFPSNCRRANNSYRVQETYAVGRTYRDGCGMRQNVGKPFVPINRRDPCTCLVRVPAIALLAPTARWSRAAHDRLLRMPLRLRTPKQNLVVMENAS